MLCTDQAGDGNLSLPNSTDNAGGPAKCHRLFPRVAHHPHHDSTSMPEHSHYQATHRNDSTLTTKICGLQISLKLSPSWPRSRSNEEEEKKALDFTLTLEVLPH